MRWRCVRYCWRAVRITCCSMLECMIRSSCGHAGPVPGQRAFRDSYHVDTVVRGRDAGHYAGCRLQSRARTGRAAACSSVQGALQMTGVYLTEQPVDQDQQD